MVETITPEKKPLFADVKKASFFQGKRKLFILGGLILFILLILGIMFYFLSKEYTTEVAMKSSLFFPVFYRRD